MTPSRQQQARARRVLALQRRLLLATRREEARGAREPLRTRQSERPSRTDRDR